MVFGWWVAAVASRSRWLPTIRCALALQSTWEAHKESTTLTQMSMPSDIAAKAIGSLSRVNEPLTLAANTKARSNSHHCTHARCEPLLHTCVGIFYQKQKYNANSTPPQYI